ncbi:MAG: hypothetical protein IJG60_06385 [Thermoguttaceae bacterium]|nr:hypothetical protein [Thermoguttaceae bacterium]
MTEQTTFRSTALPRVLKERALLLKQLRAFFDERDFFEVQTPVLSRDVLVDRYIDPFAVSAEDGIFYLQTSPEFAMKRLLASGCERIYEITPAFRRGDRGGFTIPSLRSSNGIVPGTDTVKGSRFWANWPRLFCPPAPKPKPPAFRSAPFFSKRPD